MSIASTPILTLSNYETIFLTPEYTTVIVSTLFVSAIVIVITLIIGFPAAYYLALRVHDENKRLILILIMIIPFWIDFTTKLMSWFPILGTYGGINFALQVLGLAREPIDFFILSPQGAILVMIQTYLLFMIAPILLSLVNVDPHLPHAAEALGANSFQVFRHVILPLSRPGVIIGSAFVFVSAMGDFVTPRVLGGTMQTAGLVIAQQAAVLNWPVASALSVVLILITLAVVFVMFKTVQIARMVF